MPIYICEVHKIGGIGTVIIFTVFGETIYDRKKWLTSQGKEFTLHFDSFDDGSGTPKPEVITPDLITSNQKILNQKTRYLGICKGITSKDINVGEILDLKL